MIFDVISRKIFDSLVKKVDELQKKLGEKQEKIEVEADKVLASNSSKEIIATDISIAELESLKGINGNIKELLGDKTPYGGLVNFQGIVIGHPLTRAYIYGENHDINFRTSLNGKDAYMSVNRIIIELENISVTLSTLLDYTRKAMIYRGMYPNGTSIKNITPGIYQTTPGNAPQEGFPEGYNGYGTLYCSGNVNEYAGTIYITVFGDLATIGNSQEWKRFQYH